MGRPFDPCRVQEAETRLEDLEGITFLPEGGYGLAIVRRALDTLEYERTPDGSNHWYSLTLLLLWIMADSVDWKFR